MDRNTLSMQAWRRSKELWRLPPQPCHLPFSCHAGVHARDAKYLAANLVQGRFPCDWKNPWEFSAKWNSKPVKTRKREYLEMYYLNFPPRWTLPFEFSPELPKIPVKWQSPQGRWHANLVPKVFYLPSALPWPLGWGSERPWERGWWHESINWLVLFSQRLVATLFLQQKEFIIRTRGTLTTHQDNFHYQREVIFSNWIYHMMTEISISLLITIRIIYEYMSMLFSV